MSDTFFEKELSRLEAEGMLRELYTLPEPGGEISIDGRKLVNFSSNDYLNLAGDPRLKAASVRATEKYGCGSTGSRLMSGHLELHEKLEAKLAEMTGRETALVFGSGYLTNIGVMSSLAGAGDAIFADSLNHASLIDGCRLSRAGIHPYRHTDMAHLEELLRATPTKGKRVIVSDSVFSMDGDLAPVEELAALAKQYDALLVIDEAHAIGVTGMDGGGLCRTPGREVQPDVVVGTLSKSLGGYGGFATGSGALREFLVNKARTFIYSTGLPPACLGSGIEAVSIVMSEPDLGAKLLKKASKFRDTLVNAGLNMPEATSPILPIIIGDNAKTLKFSGLLREQGLLIRAIRPPTVAAGSERVRLSVTLALSDDVLEQSAARIIEAARQTGLVR